MARHSFRFPMALVLVGLALANQAHAQLPQVQLFAIYPAGGQQGTSVELKIASALDSDDASALIFNHPGIVARQVMAPVPFRAKPQPVAGTFEVTIAPDTPPGAYDVHVVGKYGVSNAKRFFVGDMPEILEQEPNNTRETATAATINSVVNGTTDGPAHDWFKFDAKRGQRVIIDCFCERADSEADATLALFDAAGTELANSLDRIGRDPFIDFIVPADGTYYFRVHDFLYRGGPQVYYRVSVSARPSIEFVFPPSVTRGATSRVSLYGRNLPGGELTTLTSAGQPLEKLDVEVTAPPEAAQPLPLNTWLVAQQSVLDAFEYRLTTPEGASNPVLIGLTDLPVVAEAEPNDEVAQIQKITAPCEVVGQFYPQRDHDRFQFTAKKGDVYWITVFSRRLGLPTDPSLLVQRVTVDANGKETIADIQEVDDVGTSIIGLTFNTSTEDPSLRFVAPADGDYRILLRNLGELADDPRNVYRLSIAAPKGDFRLVATPRLPSADPNAARAAALFLRRGGRDLLYVGAHRFNGFAGDIQVTVEGLPPGVASPGGTILAGQNACTVPIACAEDVASWVGAIKIVGKAKVGDAEITRNADVGYVVWPNSFGAGRHVSRVADQLMLATSAGEAAPLTVEFGEGDKPFEMSRAGQLQIPVRIVRRGTIKAAVTLTPVDMPANVEAPALTFDANTNEGALTLNIKKEAPVGEWNIVLLASTTISYARNPEAVAAATAAKDEIAAAAAKLAEEVKAAEAAVQAAAANESEKADAQKKLDEAKAQAKAAEEAKAAAEKRVADLTAAAAAKDLGIVEPSGTVRLKITPAPIAIEPLTIAVKQGARVETPVNVTRLYGFNDAATLEIVASEEVQKSPEAKLLKIEAKPVAAGQTAGAVIVEAAADAKVGKTRRVLAATVKYNGQDLRIEQPVSIDVQPADN